MTALLAAVAGAAVVAAGVSAPPPCPRLPTRTPARPRRGGPASLLTVAGVAAFAVAGPLGVSLAAAAFAWAVLARRRRRRHARTRAFEEELVEVIDLVRLALTGGLNVALAVQAVVRHGTGPLTAELSRAIRDVARGASLADALAAVAARADPCAFTLLDALVAADRYGTPAGAVLERLAVEARLEARHRAERAVRRLPVQLLFPLVLCILPAFALLTVAPLVAGAVGALRLMS